MTFVYTIIKQLEKEVRNKNSCEGQNFSSLIAN
jgi:hypothetical protein